MSTSVPIPASVPAPNVAPALDVAPALRPITAGPLLADYFGHNPTQIGKIVTDFDFSNLKIKVSKGEANVYLHTGITPCFGDLNRENLPTLDDDVKVALAGTLKTLTKQKAKTYDSVLSSLMQIPLLEPDEASKVARSDKIVRQTTRNYIKKRKETEANFVDEAPSWFEELISDQDVLKDTQFDIYALANTVANNKMKTDSNQLTLTQKEYREQPLVDISVLRFPDAEHRFFKLYRVKLVDWAGFSKTNEEKTFKLGLTGEFTSKVFRPRASIIASLSEGSRANALAFANAMFGA